MTPRKPTKNSGPNTAAGGASMNVVRGKDGIEVQLAGRLDHSTAGPIWRKTLHLLSPHRAHPISIDAGQLEYADSSGIALLVYFKEFGHTQNVPVEVKNLSAPLSLRLARYLEHPRTAPVTPPPPLNLIERAGLFALDITDDLYAQVAFLGRLCLAMVRTIAHPRQFRVRDFFHICELAGSNAVGLIALLGFLFGLIMAFSSAMPLRKFGVEVYVSDLVAIALVRVLGPFITAIIVAGRTGSAFAAELGTMKINNELDALEVMNLDPAVFLALPRVMATLLMTPLLAIVTNIAGLIGSGLVILSLGYPLIAYTSHVQFILTGGDVMVGLFKSLVFGGMIGAVGCLRGLQAQNGPGAVGIATTRAVVTAIVLLILLEGMFSVVLHYLHL